MNAILRFIEWNGAIFVKSWSKRSGLVFRGSAPEVKHTQETALSFVYDEDFVWVSQMADQLLNGSIQTNTIQNRNVTRDGSVIWCEWFNSVQKNSDGKVVTIMSLVQDISESRKAL